MSDEEEIITTSTKIKDWSKHPKMICHCDCGERFLSRALKIWGGILTEYKCPGCESSRDCEVMFNTYIDEEGKYRF